MFRVGLGQDSHRLKAGGVLVLGGIQVNREMHLEADSDGDVIIHSLCNALSTAIGGGSLDAWAGAMNQSGIKDSREYLKKILEKVASQGFKISNISVAVEAGKPRLEEKRGKIQQSLAEILAVGKNCVGISFTSGEKLTSFGKGEGIQVISTVLLEK